MIFDTRKVASCPEMTGYGDICRAVSEIPVNQSLLKSEDIMHKLPQLLYRDSKLRKPRFCS